MCTLHKQRGTSLIELIMFIVIVSVALAGILLVMDTVTRSSADPLIRKQAIAIAESMLEEVELQDFNNPAGGFTGAATQANRALFDDVMDYNGFNASGSAATGIAALASYTVSVKVEHVALAGIVAADAVMITVDVRDPTGQTLTATGYRTSY